MESAARDLVCTCGGRQLFSLVAIKLEPNDLHRLCMVGLDIVSEVAVSVQTQLLCTDNSVYTPGD